MIKQPSLAMSLAFFPSTNSSSCACPRPLESAQLRWRTRDGVESQIELCGVYTWLYLQLSMHQVNTKTRSPRKQKKNIRCYGCLQIPYRELDLLNGTQIHPWTRIGIYDIPPTITIENHSITVIHISNQFCVLIPATVSVSVGFSLQHAETSIDERKPSYMM